MIGQLPSRSVSLHESPIAVPSSINDADIIEEKFVIVNQEVALTCEVQGLPSPEIAWFKDGEQLDTRGLSNIRSVFFCSSIGLSIERRVKMW